MLQTEEKEDEEEEALVGEVKASPNADTTILFVKGEGDSPIPQYHWSLQSSDCETLTHKHILGTKC